VETITVLGYAVKATEMAPSRLARTGCVSGRVVFGTSAVETLIDTDPASRPPDPPTDRGTRTLSDS